MTAPTTPSPERQPADAGGELLPCPWCGGEGWLNDYEARWGDMPPKSRCPQCRSCGANLGYRPTPAKAIAAWNRRTPAPQAQPDARAVEALKAANEALAMVTAFEDDARYIMGNTNFTILQQRREQVKQALQSLSTPAADDGWRPIESAPKDGTEIIIYGQGWTSAPRAKWIDRDAENNEGEQITFGGWALASDWECFGVEDGFIGWNEDIDEGRMPTLWMPLPVALHPAAPTDEVEKS